MKFFSGFCFQNEMKLFAPFAKIDSKYTISGFSYGAIKAFNEAFDLLSQNKRIQTLNLFSPAFFQNQKESFKKAQILGFKKDSKQYIKTFLSLCGNPPSCYFKEGKLEELEELLFFEWNQERLRFLQTHQVQINIFIGGEDKIISPQCVREFFTPFGIVHYHKSLNHCLQYDHP